MVPPQGLEALRQVVVQGQARTGLSSPGELREGVPPGLPGRPDAAQEALEGQLC